MYPLTSLVSVVGLGLKYTPRVKALIPKLYDTLALHFNSELQNVIDGKSNENR